MGTGLGADASGLETDASSLDSRASGLDAEFGSEGINRGRGDCRAREGAGEEESGEVVACRELVDDERCDECECAGLDGMG